VPDVILDQRNKLLLPGPRSRHAPVPSPPSSNASITERVFVRQTTVTTLEAVIGALTSCPIRRGAGAVIALSRICVSGGTTVSVETDGGRGDAVAMHHDSGTHASDSSASDDAARPDTKDGGASDACPTLPPDADIQCGKPCAFPGYFSPCPPDLGNPIGVSCSAPDIGAPLVWECSEG
jgi:hypothetical protein